METVKSRYKWGFALLVLVNIIFFPIAVIMIFTIYKHILMANYTWQRFDIGASYFILLGLISFIQLTSQCKHIIVEVDTITFINPMFPFLRKTHYWEEYDCVQTVNEFHRIGRYEVLWLIKNGKLKYRISSFYYSNYKELKNSLHIENRGKLNINSFRQVGCWFGMKI